MVEGSNVAIEERNAEGQFDRLPILAAELVRREVAVIVAVAEAAQAAKYATTTIPIVFLIGGDPVQMGLVASLNRPGGNITGFTAARAELQGKRLALARELLPNASIIATFTDPGRVIDDIPLRDLEAAAAGVGQRLLVLRTTSDRELEAAFISMVQQGASALCQRKLHRSRGPHRCACNASSNSNHFSFSSPGRSRRVNELRGTTCVGEGFYSPSWHVHCAHPQRREAG